MTYPDGSVPTHVFTSGTTAQSAQVNANFAETASLLNGNLLNAHINAAASISLSKLNATTELMILRAAAARCLSAGTTGDTVPRVNLSADGEVEFGPGTASALDIMARRKSADLLQVLNVGASANKGIEVSNLACTTIGDANAKADLSVSGLKLGAGGATALDLLIKRVSSTVIGLRDAGDSADVGLTVGAITNSGHIIPSATGTLDLGSTTAAFRDIFLGGSGANYHKITGTTPTGARVLTLPNSNSTTVIGASGATANQFVTHITTGGVQTTAAIAAGDLPNHSTDLLTSGTLPIARGGTNNGSLGVSALGIYNGDGSKVVQTTGTALQSWRVNAAGTAVEAFTPTTSTSPNSVCEFRLTLTSGTSVTTSDVTAAATIYFTPHNGNRIALYDGSSWSLLASAEVSASLAGLTANLPYDVYAYNNSGTLTLELVAWTNSTTRATAIAYQDGVPSKTGTLTKRLVGTVLMDATGGQTEDSTKLRGVSNVCNREPRQLTCTDGTDSWTYTTNTLRTFNNSTTLGTARVNTVSTLPDVFVQLNCLAVCRAYSSVVNMYAGIGLDSTTVSSAIQTGMVLINDATAATHTTIPAYYTGRPAVGSHAWYPLEAGGTNGTFYGDNAGIVKSGLHGYIMG